MAFWTDLVVVPNDVVGNVCVRFGNPRVPLVCGRKLDGTVALCGVRRIAAAGGVEPYTRYNEGVEEECDTESPG